ncbi:MAG: hypothetical protein ACE5GC_10185 [Acidimicrobiia bacterium]
MDWNWRATGRCLAGLAGIGVLLWFPFVLGRRVPLLSAADLGFHELGHMLAIPLGTTAHFLAGSTTQVLVPVGIAAYFWFRQRDHMATGVMLAWAASSAQDASVYIADAPYQHLPLIGGHHDWNWLLSHWQALSSASTVARAVWLAGFAAGIAGVAVCSAPLVVQIRAAMAPRPGPPAGPTDVVVREARYQQPG